MCHTATHSLTDGLVLNLDLTTADSSVPHSHHWLTTWLHGVYPWHTVTWLTNSTATVHELFTRLIRTFSVIVAENSIVWRQCEHSLTTSFICSRKNSSSILHRQHPSTMIRVLYTTTSCLEMSSFMYSSAFLPWKQQKQTPEIFDVKNYVIIMEYVM